MKKSYIIMSLSLLLMLVFHKLARLQEAGATQASWRQPGPAAGIDRGGQSAGRRRTFSDHSNRKIPLRVTSVKNLDADEWLKDMEFEIENMSNRPIYYVRLVILFPDVPRTTELDGVARGLATDILYGRKEFLLHLGELAKEGDIPIKPGEKVVLKLAPQDWKGVRSYLRRHDLPESEIKRIRVRIDELGFGDGSGYRVGSVPFFPRSSSKNRPRL